MPLSTTYTKVETDYLLQQIDKKVVEGYKGDLRISDPAPTEKGYYILLDVGTYTNLGGIVTSNNNLNFASFDGTTWSKVEVEMPSVELTLVASKNLFNKNSVIVGKEVYGDGTLKDEANSITSDVIELKSGEKYLTISGLQDNISSDRYYVFKDVNGSKITTPNFFFNGNSVTIPIPTNAVSFQFSPKQRNLDATNLDSVQVEYGGQITNYENFKLLVNKINGNELTTNLKFMYGNGKNLLNNENFIYGKEVYGDGSLADEPNSVISGVIDVVGQSSITISGLQPNPSINRYYVFRKENGTIAGVGEFSGTSKTLIIPTDAVSFNFSIKQRNSNPLDVSSAQVEFGSVATTFEPFKKTIIGINDLEIKKETNLKSFEGISLMILGDSTAETGNSDVGNFGLGVRSNFPTFLIPKLKITKFKNYARSGASFREYSGQLEWQKISRQVQQAITDKATFGEPDVIIIGCGTNDGTDNLGDYDTAIGKTIANLNMANTAEAFRKSLYELQQAFPNSKIIYGTPKQRADVETSARQPLIDLCIKMAKRYGSYIADIHSNSGIVKDFENWNASGRDLYDGLHPNVEGQKKESAVYERLIKYIFS